MEGRIEFCCQVCLSCFDSEGHQPLLLPACGHTFCAFCVQLLGQQGKTFCPKCRKDKAVQPVSSLPVNYSLLEIVQSKLTDASAEEPSSPREWTTGNKGPHKVPPELPNSPRQLNPDGLFSRSKQSRIKQGASQPYSVRRNPMHDLASGPESTGVSSSASGDTFFDLPVMQAHGTSPGQARSEKELQDEMDFQMAVHLTFCKDRNHDLDRHTSCPVWRKQMMMI